jgi:predicted HicB family RNase H-like nuclease
MGVMAKKKPPQPGKDRHGPHKMVRVPPETHELLQRMAQGSDRSIAKELKRIVAEEAKRRGLLKPPEDTST